MMIDTHCHLCFDDYDSVEDIVKKMQGNVIIASGADMKYNMEVLKYIDLFNNVYGTIGLHPDEAMSYSESDLKEIEKHLLDAKIVGIGEIGLDYSKETYNKDKQKDLFIKQLDLARKYKKPVVIHSRDSIMDTYNILKEYKDLKIIIHCFSSSVEMAKKFILLGAKLGIGGVVTFKNGKKLQEVVKSIDISSLVLETDSPYLTPEPYRGKINEPYNTLYVAKKIAELKQMSLEEVLKITTQNAKNVYNI